MSRGGPGFRTRLTLAIAAAFVLGAAALLGVQYLVLGEVVSSSVGSVASECVEVGTPDGSTDGSTECSITSGSGDEVAALGSLLSTEVRGTMLRWSFGTLVVFAALSVLAAQALARHTLARIATITAAARGITDRDISRRLHLTGPHDEIRELGDTIDGMLDRLERAFQAQTQFVGNASHELRTPLTLARTALEIPLTRGEVPDSLRPAVEQALRANARSDALIEALLTLARARADVPGEGAPLDLRDLVLACLDRHADEVASRGVVVTVTGDATVLADPATLPLAVDNLVRNGVRHNAPGGALAVTLADDPGTGRALLRVENDGDHLTPDDVAHLTEPFHRGRRTRLADGPSGLGLGLSLTESVLAAHGGDLALVPRPAGGLLAQVTLPSRTGGPGRVAGQDTGQDTAASASR